MLVLITSFILTTLNLGVLVLQLFLKVSRFKSTYFRQFIELTCLMLFHNATVLFEEYSSGSNLSIILSRVSIAALFLYPQVVLFKRLKVRLSPLIKVIVILLNCGLILFMQFTFGWHNLIDYSFPLASVVVCALIIAIKGQESAYSKFILSFLIVLVVMINTWVLWSYISELRQTGLILLNAMFFFIVSVLFKEYIQKLREIQHDTPIEGNSINAVFRNYGLTSREIEIAIYILQDMSYQEIADTCSISNKTVGKHASNVFKKVGVNRIIDFRVKFEKVLNS